MVSRVQVHGDSRGQQARRQLRSFAPIPSRSFPATFRLPLHAWFRVIRRCCSRVKRDTREDFAQQIFGVDSSPELHRIIAKLCDASTQLNAILRNKTQAIARDAQLAVTQHVQVPQGAQKPALVHS